MNTQHYENGEHPFEQVPSIDNGPAIFDYQHGNTFNTDPLTNRITENPVNQLLGLSSVDSDYLLGLVALLSATDGNDGLLAPPTHASVDINDDIRALRNQLDSVSDSQSSSHTFTHMPATTVPSEDPDQSEQAPQTSDNDDDSSLLDLVSQYHSIISQLELLKRSENELDPGRRQVSPSDEDDELSELKLRFKALESTVTQNLPETASGSNDVDFSLFGAKDLDDRYSQSPGIKIKPALPLIDSPVPIVPPKPSSKSKRKAEVKTKRNNNNKAAEPFMTKKDTVPETNQRSKSRSKNRQIVKKVPFVKHKPATERRNSNNSARKQKRVEKSSKVRGSDSLARLHDSAQSSIAKVSIGSKVTSPEPPPLIPLLRPPPPPPPAEYHHVRVNHLFTQHYNRTPHPILPGIGTVPLPLFVQNPRPILSYQPSGFIYPSTTLESYVPTPRRIIRRNDVFDVLEEREMSISPPSGSDEVLEMADVPVATAELTSSTTTTSMRFEPLLISTSNNCNSRTVFHGDSASMQHSVISLPNSVSTSVADDDIQIIDEETEKGQATDPSDCLEKIDVVDNTIDDVILKDDDDSLVQMRQQLIVAVRQKRLLNDTVADTLSGDRCVILGDTVGQQGDQKTDDVTRDVEMPSVIVASTSEPIVVEASPKAQAPIIRTVIYSKNQHPSVKNMTIAERRKRMKLVRYNQKITGPVKAIQKNSTFNSTDVKYGYLDLADNVNRKSNENAPPIKTKKVDQLLIPLGMDDHSDDDATVEKDSSTEGDFVGAYLHKMRLLSDMNAKRPGTSENRGAGPKHGNDESDAVTGELRTKMQQCQQFMVQQRELVQRDQNKISQISVAISQRDSCVLKSNEKISILKAQIEELQKIADTNQRSVVKLKKDFGATNDRLQANRALLQNYESQWNGINVLLKKREKSPVKKLATAKRRQRLESMRDFCIEKIKNINPKTANLLLPSDTVREETIGNLKLEANNQLNVDSLWSMTLPSWSVDLCGDNEPDSTFENTFESIRSKFVSPENDRKMVRQVPGASTSYESPLLCFKSYRLSPFFNDSLYTSLTWSNQLDCIIPLCPFDVHGRCLDSACKMQHMHHLSLVNDCEIVRDILTYRTKDNANVDKESDVCDRCGLQSCTKEEDEQESNPADFDTFPTSSKLSDVITSVLGNCERSVRLRKRRFPRDRAKHSLDSDFVHSETEVLHRDVTSSSVYSGKLSVLNRYFKSQHLSSSGIDNVKDVDFWLKITEIELQKNSSTRLTNCLKLLSNGLNHNRNSSKLWLKYIEVFELSQTSEDTEKIGEKITQLVENALDNAPSYELFWKALQLYSEMDRKCECARRCLDFLTKDHDASGIPFVDEKFTRIVLFIIDLYLQELQSTRATEFIDSIIGAYLNSLKCLRMSTIVFLLLCKIHLVCFDSLPWFVFDGYSGNLLNMDAFEIDWNKITISEGRGDRIDCCMTSIIDLTDFRDNNDWISLYKAIYGYYTVFKMLQCPDWLIDLLKHSVLDFDWTLKHGVVDWDDLVVLFENSILGFGNFQLRYSYACVYLYNLSHFKTTYDKQIELKILQVIGEAVTTEPIKWDEQSFTTISLLYKKLLGIEVAPGITVPDLVIATGDCIFIWLCFCLLETFRNPSEIGSVYEQAFNSFNNDVKSLRVIWKRLDYSFHNDLLVCVIEIYPHEEELKLLNQLILMMPNNIMLKIRFCKLLLKIDITCNCCVGDAELNFFFDDLTKSCELVGDNFIPIQFLRITIATTMNLEKWSHVT